MADPVATPKALNAAAAKLAQTMKMTAHPQVTVTLVTGAITNVGLKVLGVMAPEIAAVLAGSEGDLSLIVGALAGFFTGRSA